VSWFNFRPRKLVWRESRSLSCVTVRLIREKRMHKMWRWSSAIASMPRKMGFGLSNPCFARRNGCRIDKNWYLMIASPQGSRHLTRMRGRTDEAHICAHTREYNNRVPTTPLHCNLQQISDPQMLNVIADILIVLQVSTLVVLVLAQLPICLPAR